MGLRGPVPTPTPILAQHGSRAVYKRKGEPACPVAVPPTPETLTGEALAEWNRQAELLTAMGVLAEQDRAILAIWCVTWADFIRLRKAMKGKKSTGKGVAWLYKDARDTLLKIAAQFGFTPAARTRLKAEVPKVDDDPIAAMITRPNQN